jgi:uncharacterized protein
MAVTADRATRLERSVGIDAPIKDVWAALLDLERVVPCLPGVEITDVDEDGAYHGTLRVKFGPRSTVYRGTLRLEAVNRRARRAVVAVSWSGQAARVATATVVGRADASVIVPIPTEWWLRPVNRAARVGAHSAVVWKRLNLRPSAARRSAVGVRHGREDTGGAEAGVVEQYHQHVRCTVRRAQRLDRRERGIGILRVVRRQADVPPIRDRQGRASGGAPRLR